MKSVGFIGLGTMGEPMAANLLKHGYAVTVYNRTIEKTEQLVRRGAETAPTPAETARSVDVLITMVSNDAALQEVYYGTNGIFAGIQPGLTVIDCSTVSPNLSRKLARDLGDHFVAFLDAPVTGSKPAAIDGTLVFMVGGSEEILEEHTELLLAMGRKIIHLGPNGSGSVAKLAHNTIVGINNAALAEGFAIAAKAGIDPEPFLELVLSGGAQSKAAELKGRKIIEHDFSNQFSLALMLKDLKLSSTLAGDLQVSTPMLEAAKSVFQTGIGKGYGDLDMSAVVQCYEDWMNAKVERKAKNEQAAGAEAVSQERRRSARLHMGIELQLSVYQWEQEGAFSGQVINGTLYDLSDTGLLIESSYPLARDMFIVIHFPQDSGLPPMTGKIIRIEPRGELFRYGCTLSGLPPYQRIQLEQYIARRVEQENRG